MNSESRQTKGASRCSPAEALAMKNAALRAMLGYLEYKHGPGEWFKDELAYRFHRMVSLALEAPGEPNQGERPLLTAPDRKLENRG